MIHKNIYKTSNQHKSKPNTNMSEILSEGKLLLHYGSMNSICVIAKENKQQKQCNSLKVSHICRHVSQEELKKFSEGSLINCQNSIYGEEDGKSEQKKIVNSSSSTEEYQKLIDSKNSRGSIEGQAPKVINDLKQTSSTASAERIITVKRQIPAFLKTKTKIVPPRKNGNRKFNKDGFIIHKKLGEGKFGKVYLTQQLVTGFLLAMKVVEKKKIISENFLDQFIRQLKIQTYLSHPNIIEVYGYFEDDQYFYTLIELGCDGQLYNLINDKKKLTEQGTSFITKNLLQAVDHMHHLNILHRDIKAENVVRIMGNVKICDFGWAVNKLTKQQLRSTYCGTPLYLSPEVLKGQKYDEKVDLWAIGILTYQLLLGKSPFQIYQYEDLYKIMTEQVHFPPNKKVSKQFEEFISHMLCKNPKQRLSSSELLDMKFIKKYEGFETCEELCQ